MITARFYQKPSNGSIHMTLKGHAESAPKGEDLICSAATMMAYTVAQAVQFMYEQDKLTKKPKIRIKDGEATIIATPTEEAYAEALHTFWVAQCGIHVLAHNYPKNVTMEHLKV
jgi:uncharacterized protein YsxB (DUF464 family)